MEKLLEELRSINGAALTYERLGELVRSVDVSTLAYKELIPEQLESGSYSRNILLMEPLECVLLYWPAGAESAIHWHKGFWGYVLVLEGECLNVEYKHKGEDIIETDIIRASKGGVLNEPDSVIHKLVNPNNKPAVTLHFYCPALKDLEGMVIYSEDGTEGVLNEKATSAIFDQDKENFRSITKNKFNFIPFTKNRTHRIAPIIPKPAHAELQRMTSAYYSEQADVYDMFDLNDDSRRNYVERIDELTAEDWRTLTKPKNALIVACGTGRRAQRISALSGLGTELTGVDISDEMSEVARERGLNAITSDWLEVELPDDNYDTATFLYALGHVPDRSTRQNALNKLSAKLKVGGALFFDVFNALDIHEWGPNAIENYFRNHLYRFGYERGDVFYKKVGGSESAFLHYFYQDEIHEMLDISGFRVEYIKHIGYVYRSGEILASANEGSLFIKAIKK